MASSCGTTSILAFVKSTRIALANPEATSNLSKAELDLYLNALPVDIKAINKSVLVELRGDAIAIWNAVETDSQRSSPLIAESIALRLQVLAHSLLAASVTSRNVKREVSIQTLTQAVSVLQKCLNATELQLASQVVAMESENQLLHDGIIDQGDDDVLSLLGAFFSLCILLGVREHNTERAEGAYRRLKNIVEYLTEEDVEICVDTFLNAGEGRLDLNEPQEACQWFERALDAMFRSPFTVSFESSEAKLRTLHGLVRAKMRLPGSSGQWQAYDYLEQLKQHFGAKMPVLLLNLELNFSRTEVDPVSAEKDLRQMITNIHIIDSNHFIIMHNIRKLSKLDLASAVDVLFTYLTTRVLPESRQRCAEDGIVMFVELQTTLCLGNARIGEQFSERLTTISQKLEGCLSEGAAQAALMIVWRTVQELDFHTYADLIADLCNVGLHDLFATAGDTCLAVLQRHLITLALADEKHDLARSILEKMSPHERNHRDTSYLEYRLYLKLDEDAESQRTLDHILRTLGSDRTLLRICIDQAAVHKKQLHIVRLLQHMIDTGRSGDDPELQSNGALKYLCQILMQALSSEEAARHTNYDLLNRLCGLFKHVSRQNSHGRQYSGPDQIDLGWFANRCFEIATLQLQQWPRRYLIDLLGYGIAMCPVGADALIELTLTEAEQTQYRDMCYCQTILLVAEARSVDEKYTMEEMPRTAYHGQNKPWSNNYQLVLYTRVFNTFTKLNEMYDNEGLVRGKKENSLAQLHVVLPLAFEALIYMSASEYMLEGKAFNEVSVRLFVQSAAQLGPPVSAWPMLADIVLIFSDMSSSVALRNGLRIPYIAAANLLAQIISILHQNQSSSSTEQAARWIRCIVQLVLDDIEQKVPKVVIEKELKCHQSLNMLESLVKQSLTLARDTSPAYPTEELQWLSAKLFNMALDLQSAQQVELAGHWTTVAVDVAAAMGDAGRAFHQLLTEKAQEKNMA